MSERPSDASGVNNAKLTEPRPAAASRANLAKRGRSGVPGHDYTLVVISESVRLDQIIVSQLACFDKARRPKKRSKFTIQGVISSGISEVVEHPATRSVCRSRRLYEPGPRVLGRSTR